MVEVGGRPIDSAEVWGMVGGMEGGVEATKKIMEFNEQTECCEVKYDARDKKFRMEEGDRVVLGTEDERC